jgi:membrane fusion protein, multidrug efflux system
MKKQLFWSVVIILILLSFFGGVKYWQILGHIANASKFGPPPSTVSTYVVKKITWPSYLRSVGTLKAVSGALLSAEEAGLITDIAIQSGEKVEKGQVLVKINPSFDEAQLAGARAVLKNASDTLEREKKLRAREANSIAALDLAQANYLKAAADVAGFEAQISRKQIVAPFSGIAGVVRVNKGDVVSQGAEIVSVQDLSKLYVRSYLPQNDLLKLGVNAASRPVCIKINTLPDKEFCGSLNAVDSRVDPISRNTLIEGVIDNLEGLLKPGMFVDVQVEIDSDEQSLVVPVSSVLRAPYGDYIYVIAGKADKDGLYPIRSQNVRLGEERGELVAVNKGLNVGDQVVASGGFKLSPVSKVKINNDIPPATNTEPNAQNS